MRCPSPAKSDKSHSKEVNLWPFAPRRERAAQQRADRRKRGQRGGGAFPRRSRLTAAWALPMPCLSPAKSDKSQSKEVNLWPFAHFGGAMPSLRNAARNVKER
jgi:hypothetical protein